MTATSWTKSLVQQHAQVAVAIEIYTLPFYFTAMTSIIDKTSNANKTINRVCIEEMLHLQLAGNLCLALDVNPVFTIPRYGVDLPYLKPDDPATNHYALVNATLGAFDSTTLGTMLDIETPEEFEAIDHSTPQYPYNSIGDFYDALLAGIKAVEAAQPAGTSAFGWKAGNQQDTWAGQVSGLTAIITNVTDAATAIKTINEQGEGKAHNPVPKKPYTGSQFPIESAYQLSHANTTSGKKDTIDTSDYYKTSHFGRFIDLQNAATTGGFPPVYPLQTPQSTAAVAAQSALQSDFITFLANLNSVWRTGAALDFVTMPRLAPDATACWAAGVIPNWG